jgi:hypothetical protein
MHTSDGSRSSLVFPSIGLYEKVENRFMQSLNSKAYFMRKSDLLKKYLPNRPQTWVFALATCIYFWIICEVPIIGWATGKHDDAHFVEGAFHILHGDWLGKYDEMTLIKGPFYPIFIALNFIFRIPLLISQGILYWASGIMVFSAISKIFRNSTYALIGFIVFLFNPIITNGANLKVLREGVYVPLYCFLGGGILWLWILKKNKFRQRAKLSVVLGVLTFFFWTTREEGIWIVPGAICAFLYIAAFNIRSQTSDRFKVCKNEFLLIVILVGVAWTGVQGIRTINYLKYGQPVVTEFSNDNAFLGAYGAMTRVVFDDPIDHVPVSRKTFAEMSKYSPALEEIHVPLFNQGWELYLCENPDKSKCEIQAGWFMWAVRDAVAKIGYYTTAAKANAYYDRVTTELRAACNTGKLQCLPFQATTHPIFRWADVPKTIHVLGIAIVSTFIFEPYDLSEAALRNSGDPNQLHAFLNLTRSLDRTYLSKKRILPVLRFIHLIYKWGFPFIALAGITAFLIACLRRHRLPRGAILILLIFGFTMLTRLALLSYVTVTSFPAILVYMSPCYPALIILITTFFASAFSPPEEIV